MKKNVPIFWWIIPSITDLFVIKCNKIWRFLQIHFKKSTSFLLTRFSDSITFLLVLACLAAGLFSPQKMRNQRRDLVHSFSGSALTLPPSKVQSAIKSSMWFLSASEPRGWTLPRDGQCAQLHWSGGAVTVWRARARGRVFVDGVAVCLTVRDDDVVM